MDTFFPTSSVEEITPPTPAAWAEMQTQITNLNAQVDRLIADRTHWQNKYNELQQKIANVKGYFFDLYSMNGRVEEEIKEIAELLDITLTKEIQGTAVCEISWTASVPLDFDADDFEISFDVNCETYEAEDFSYNEDSCDVSGEDV